MSKFSLSILLISILSLPNPATAARISLDFETTRFFVATPGDEASNIYRGLGVRFPSRPTIEREGNNQFLKQGTRTGGPGPSRIRVVCDALEIEFLARMDVRQVSMRVFNRHMRGYEIRAFSGGVEVDRFSFNSAGQGPQLPLRTFRDIALTASSEEGGITRVVAQPPADCFDLMLIDNLAYETTRPVATIEAVPPPEMRNHIKVLAYEVSQGVMSRMTRNSGPEMGRPDTRLMADTSRSLSFISGRTTGVRFFLGASARDANNYNATLSSTITFKDGSRLDRDIGENTTGPGGPRLATEPFVPYTPGTLSDRDLRRQLVLRRARTDRTIDFVIPGVALVDAVSVNLRLRAPQTNATLAQIHVDLEGPYRMGVNFWRINGIGAGAALGPAPPALSTRSWIQQYFTDVYPVSGVVGFVNQGTVTLSQAFANCELLLTRMNAIAAGTLTTAGTAPPAPVTPITNVPGVNFSVNMFVTQTPPPDCLGRGRYSNFGALTNPSPDVAAHEAGHNFGLNHASNLHGESSGSDWETWPYLHGSIGTVDESQPGYGDGVFGLVMAPTAASSGNISPNNWGTWIFGPIAPCPSAAEASVFPNCSLGDAQVVHDFMSNGTQTVIPIYTSPADTSRFFQNLRWVSDLNYFRATRFFQSCLSLDPQNRAFNSGNVAEPQSINSSGACLSAASLMTGVGADSQSANRDIGASADALIFSGLIGEDGKVSNFHTLRKQVPKWAFRNPKGDHELIVLTSKDGSGSKIPFQVDRLSSSKDQKTGQQRSFVVVVPYTAELSEVQISSSKGTIFKKAATAGKPEIKLAWLSNASLKGTKAPFLRWSIEDRDKDPLDVFVQFSVDDGKNWAPLALMQGEKGQLLLDQTELPASKSTRFLVSASDGLQTSFEITDPVSIEP